MASKSNEILMGIYRGIAQMNGTLDKMSKNKSSDPMMGRMTTPMGQPSAAAPAAKSAGVVGKLSDAANSIKTLSELNMKDVVKVSLMPLKSAARNVKNFTTEIGAINDKSIVAADKAIQGFSNLLTTITDINAVKLTAKLIIFPTKLLNNFILDFGATTKLIDKTFKANVISKAARNNMTSAKGVILDVLDIRNQFGVTDKVKFGLAAYGLILTAKFVRALSILSLYTTKKFSMKRKAKMATSMFVIKYFMNSIGNIVKDMAIKGLFAIAIMPMVMLGFAINKLTLTSISWLSFATQKTGRQAKRGTKASGNILLFCGALTLIVVGIMSIGIIMNKLGGWGAVGMGIVTMGAALLAMFAIMKLTQFVGSGKNTRKSMMSAKNILFFIGGMMLISVGIIAVGAITNQLGGWKAALLGITIMAASVGGMWLISKIASKAGKSAKKGLLSVGILIALGAAMEGLAFGMVKLGKTVDEAGGWATIGNALGVVAATIGEFTVIALAIGGLMMIPMLPVVMGAGIATLTGLGVAFLSITTSAQQMANLGKTIRMDEVSKAGRITQAFVTEMKKMIKTVGSVSAKDIIKATAAIVPIGGLIADMGLFARLLRDFAGDEGYLKVKIGVDKDGNPIFDKKGVHIETASVAISNGFSTFVTTVFKAIDDSNAKSVSLRTVEKINRIMDPVAKFANIIQTFACSDDGSEIFVARYDEQGNLVKDQKVNIPSIGFAIGAGFGMFVENVFEKISAAEEYNVSRRTIKKINKLMEPVRTFVDIVTRFSSGESSDGKLMLKQINVDEEGNITEGPAIDIVGVGDLIGNTFVDFVSKIDTALQSADNLSASRKSIKKISKITDVIKDFANNVSAIFDSDSKRTDFRKNTEDMNYALGKLAGLYNTKLDATLATTIPKLKTANHDFMAVLERDTKSIKKPLREYVDLLNELTEGLTNLKPKLDECDDKKLTLVIEKGINTTTKVDNPKAFSTALNDKDLIAAYAAAIAQMTADRIDEKLKELSLNPIKNKQGGYTID